MSRKFAHRRSTCLGLVIALFGMAAFWATAAAQSTADKVPRVGVLGVTSPAGYARQIAAMREGFRELGHIDGRNILIDFQWADGRDPVMFPPGLAILSTSRPLHADPDRQWYMEARKITPCMRR